jgi:hypothetical protein
MFRGVRTVLFWLKVIVIALSIAALLWQADLDSVSEQEAIERVNAAYRPIHQKLDAQYRMATRDHPCR